MEKVRLTKIFTFETAHALYGYDGKCKNIHGHSYKLHVTIEGIPINDFNSSKNGMVLDFGILKSIVNKEIINHIDHAILLNSHSPHYELAQNLIDQQHNVILVDFQPTCENMILDFKNKIMAQLPENISLVRLQLFETETSYCEWTAN
jgi:6-pyruvoyltetrahydropterin/6-carboxytetrahydropterin synthase